MNQPDSRQFREVMSRFPTGVTVVSARASGPAFWGLTVNSFTSVSLDPPLILVCIDRESASHDKLVAAETFAVSVLAEDQADIATRFAAEPAETRFEQVAWHEASRGSPVLDGAAAWLECASSGVMPGGDHSIVLGRVIASGASDNRALLFFKGDYGKVAM
jgi:flavin reductase (DIM6/NTAB) family NADH-FMN oxidoreductase RutF